MIRTYLNKVLPAAIALVMAASAAAQVTTLPVTKIDGKIYHYYKVEPKESIYSLQHKLKVSKDEIIRHNPSASEGLKAGMMLYFPFDTDGVETAAPVATASGHTTATPAATPTATHTVKKGETLFGLAKRYHMTERELVELNPRLATEGLKAGETIRISAPAEPKPATEPATAKPMGFGYVVKDKETFYSIARDHNITVAQLEAANPDVTILKKGQVLTIPTDETTASPAIEPNDEDLAASEPATPATEEAVTPADSTVVATEEPAGVNITLILPFMLEQETPSKQAMRYTEFYKGFLIAADSLRNTSTPINIRAYDSALSVDTVRHILADSTLLESDVIIAPDDVAELATIGNWGKANDVLIFNAFAVRDGSYTTNPSMMQTNIPSDKMYRKAAEGFIKVMGDYTPVIVSRKGSSRDKSEFLSDLSSLLEAKGVKALTIEFDNKLTPADLADLDPTGNYIFVPVTGKQVEINKILHGLISWRDNTVTPGVKVFGYPEWTTFKGETLQNMHALNTTVYSRFTVDENSYRNHDFDRRFKRWYGNEMENVAPRQGLLGFDSGMYLIRMLLTDGRKPSDLRYSGIQNDYNFIAVPGGGWVNDSLSLINYRPGGSTEKSSI